MKLNEALQTPSLDWDFYETKALTMTYEELDLAAIDAFLAAQANPTTEGLYMDEVSVYRGEQRRRRGE